MVDGSGNALLDRNERPILVSARDTRVSVAGDGTMSSENGQLGRIAVVRPVDPMKLKAEGATLFDPDGPVEPARTPGIVQGAVEDSNVQPVLEIARMIEAHRTYEFAAQLIQAEFDRQRDAVDKLLPAQR